MPGICHFCYLFRFRPLTQRNELSCMRQDAEKVKGFLVVMDNHAFQVDDARGFKRTLEEQENQMPFTVSIGHQPRNENNDYLVEVNSRAKLLKKPIFYKIISICCLILAIIFFIVMVIFISLYSKSIPKVCTSKECLKTASSYLSSMNLNVDPCENFYEFACGKWSEEHPNHGWWSSFSSFTTISEKVAIASMNILNVENSGSEPDAVRKSRDLFKSCMDTETLDQLGIAAMYPFLKKMNIPSVPTFMSADDQTGAKFDWLRTDALAKNVLLMDIFMGATVGPNIFNGSQNVFYIGQIYQTSPLPSPLKSKSKVSAKGIIRKDSDDDDDDETIKELIKSVNINIIKYLISEVILNITEEEANEYLLEKAANIIVDMSYVIDEIVTNTTDVDQQEVDTYTITIEYLQSEINKGLKKPQTNFLIRYLKYLFNDTNVILDAKTDLLYVTELDVVFLKMIMQYLTGMPEINIELYTWWVTVYAMVFSTSNDISEYITKQLNIFSSGPETVVRSRSLECTLLVNNYMGYAVSYALADQSFLNVTKPKVERMVLGLKEAFVSHVNEISWMDSKTKKATLEKSKEMISFIGYPEWLFQEGELDKYYSDVAMQPDTYLENMVNVIISHAKQNLNSLRKVHQRDWYSEPIEVNAFNSFSDNAINVPMAILNFPMYHLGLEVLNYGSIGSILGHELTHGFDNIGRQHDKYGNFVQWWTNQTIEAFESFTDCFVQQYENFSIPGLEGHVNGQVTLSENLADNGGLNQAFRAYKKNVEYDEELKLPGFENYSNSQMFFLAYANVWCQTANREEIILQLSLDVHSPNPIRVLANLQNSLDFAKAFRCPVGSPMNPEKKCKIW